MDSSSVTASKGDIKVAGTLAADVLTISSDVQINIGDQGSAGRVVARQAQLQGGRVFLDPAWKGNDALADASHGVFTFVNNEIDGLLTAGQNFLLLLGDTDTGWALDAFGRSSLQWGQNGVIRRAGYPEAADVERYARRGDGGRNQDQRSGIDSEYGDFR